MIKYIIFNGPRKCGKTLMAKELARYMRQYEKHVIIDAFAAPIKHFFAAALAEKYENLDSKQWQRSELNGFRMMDALAMLTEGHLKPSYGEDILGKWLVHRSLKYPGKKPNYVVVDDGRFPAEIDAVPNRFVVSVRKEGRAFIGDAGDNYVTAPHWIIDNEGDLSTVWIKMAELAKHIVETF